jgi:hypothetical protein
MGLAAPARAGRFVLPDSECGPGLPGGRLDRILFGLLVRTPTATNPQFGGMTQQKHASETKLPKQHGGS